MLYDGFGYFVILTGKCDLSISPLMSDTRLRSDKCFPYRL